MQIHHQQAMTLISLECYHSCEVKEKARFIDKPKQTYEALVKEL